MEVQAIVDDLAESVRRPITLEDAAGKLVAYSIHEQPVDLVRMETLLRKGASTGTLDALRSRGVYQFIDSSLGVARVPSIPEIGFGSRACVAIRAADRILGYLWVADVDSTMPKSSEEAMLRARHLLSLELGKRESALLAKREQREQLIADLCEKDQADNDALARRAKTLGWYPAPPLQVVVIRPQGTVDRLTDRLTDLENLFSQHVPSSLRGVYRGEIVAVVSGREVKASRDLADAVAAGPSAPDRAVAVGIGGVCRALPQVKRSYLEASAAITLGAKMNTGARYFDYGTLAPYELLSCLSSCRKAGSYGREAIDRVITYDGLHGGSLFDTLEAFLDSYGRRKAAAARLSIHPNTLDYRIRKAEELMGLDLDDPSARLVAHIWVKALFGQVRGTRSAETPGGTA